MDLTPSWMNPELESFRDAVHRFVASEIAPHQQRWREDRYGHEDAARQLQGRHLRKKSTGGGPKTTARREASRRS